MINTLRLYEELTDTFGEGPARTLTRVIGSIYDDLQNTVTKEDFRELKQVVAELAQAQKRTEERVEELAQAQKRTEQRVEELAQAQKRTEERVEELAQAQKRTEQRVEELAQAQKRTEERVEELAQAQKRTEQRLEELAQAQQRTEQRLEELAQAQKRTEDAVYHLSRRVDDTNRQLGGLAMTVGYTLENTAYVYLPDLLRTDYGLTCEGSLSRDYLTDLKGRDVEVNILGRGKLGDREVLIVGESKAQLGKNDVKDFLKRLSRLDTGGLSPFPVLVTHMISQRDVKTFAKSQGVAVYLSYQLQKTAP